MCCLGKVASTRKLLPRLFTSTGVLNGLTCWICTPGWVCTPVKGACKNKSIIGYAVRGRERAFPSWRTGKEGGLKDRQCMCVCGERWEVGGFEGWKT